MTNLLTVSRRNPVLPGALRHALASFALATVLLVTTAPASADCNNNGQDDLIEYDQDGDGIISACDNCLLVPNPLQIDSNEDGYGNACDADLNNDGIINVVDLGILRDVFFTDDADADFNVDGVVNFIDLGLLRATFFESPGPGLPEAAVTPDAPVTDIDGNTYQTVRIGDQIWTRENLKTTTFNTGEPIPQYDSDVDNDWIPGFGSEDAEPRYQWASTLDLANLFDEELPFDFFGALYNDIVIESGNVCPVGWRVPSREDFEALEAFVVADGFAGQAASALKATFSWVPGQNGVDAYGFNGLAAGYVSAVGTPTGGAITAVWATSEIVVGDFDIRRRLHVQLVGNGGFGYGENALRIGAAVRCIKNQGSRQWLWTGQGR